MHQEFGSAILAATVAALAIGCNHNSSPTAATSAATPSANAGTVTTANPSGSTLTPTSSVSDPGGEWNLTTPNGLPRGGCVSVNDLAGNEVDWTVQSVANHPHRILLEGIWTWEKESGCNPLAPGGDLTRSMQITGGGWTFLAHEQGTRTISWPTSYCGDDGGRFKLDVLVRRDVPSIGDGDRESVELILDCGFVRQP